MRVDSTVVITQAATSPIIDLNDARDALGLADDDTAGDTALARLCGQATAAIESHCRRRLRAETVTESFSVFSPTARLTLDRWPVGAVLGVTIGGVDIDPATIELDGEAGVLHRLSAAGTCRILWPAGRIVVTYRAGYESDAFPLDIVGAAMALIEAGWHSRGRDPLVKRESVPGVLDVSYGLPTAGIPDHVAAALAPHVRVLV